MKLFSHKYNHRFTTFFTNSINSINSVVQKNFKQQNNSNRNNINQAMKQVLLNGLLLPKIWLKPQTLDYQISQDSESQKQWNNMIKRQENGQGTLILTPHLGLFEFIPRLIALNNKPFFALYKPSRKEWVNRLLSIGRNFPNIQMCPANMSGVKKMVQALKNGQISGLLPDQVPTDGDGVIANFFNKPAKTMVLPFRLAKMANVPLIWVIVIPYIEKNKLSLTVYLKEHKAEQESIQLQATQMNLEIEKWVRQFPTHYLWSYNRYKNID